VHPEPAASAQAYIDGSYDAKTGGTWHLEDAPYKASQVLRMLSRHPEVDLNSICDLGCGAGGVIAELSRTLPDRARFTGYEISPQAHLLSRRFENERCTFLHQNPFASDSRYGLALALDVVEHVEDCFGFMRQCARKGTWKMYHVPLDTSASMAVRGANCWDSVGHLHLFTLETALKSVAHCDQEIVDWFLTPTSLERPHRRATHVTNLIRRILPAKLASRLVGGYSVMILAK
jgi:SAM-dependent methyltransferase